MPLLALLVLPLLATGGAAYLAGNAADTAANAAVKAAPVVNMLTIATVAIVGAFLVYEVGRK